MGKRAQSAMEYLMTYGWVILIITVVVVVLVKYGVFSGTNFVSNSCIMPANFGCVSMGTYLSSNGLLHINFEQSTTSTTSITAIACNRNQALTNFNTISPGVTLFTGGNATFNVECYSNGVPFNGVVGSIFQGYIMVNYTNQQSAFTHTIVGTIVQKVEH